MDRDGTAYGEAGKGPKCEAINREHWHYSGKVLQCKHYARQNVGGRLLCNRHAMAARHGFPVPTFGAFVPATIGALRLELETRGMDDLALIAAKIEGDLQDVITKLGPLADKLIAKGILR